MAAIDIKAFSGLRPLLDPLLLETPEAVVADNVQLTSGTLAPLLGTTTLKALTKINPQTIWRYGTSSTETEHWLEFLAETDVMASPLPEDIWARAYWTDGIKPKYGDSATILSGSSYPGASYDLGIPAPETAPFIASGQSLSTPTSLTLTADQVNSIVQAGKMKVDVLRILNGNTSNTHVTAGGTATSIAAWLSTISGFSATASGGSITIIFTNDIANASIFTISGTAPSYDPAVVTYTPHLFNGAVINPISGTFVFSTVDGDLIRGAGDPAGDPALLGPAVAVFGNEFIPTMTPGERYTVEVNGGPAVAVTIQAGEGTFPPVATPESVRLSFAAASDADALVIVEQEDQNEQPLYAVILKTKTTGNTSTLRVRKVNAAQLDIFSPFVAWSTTTASTEARTIVITYVSAYGEEGPPSPASTVVTLDPAQPATYSNLATTPSGAYNITTKRIYRSSTVGSAAQFQFVDEIPVSQSSYTDTKSQAELGEILPSENWIAPPAALKGLRMLASGAAIGFVGNTAYVSEPNLPHAWPHKYPIDFQIVGVAAFDQSAVLVTTGYPFILDGADPAAMTPRRLNLRQSCVSRGSIVETEGGVLYASPDGLVAIDSGGANLVSTKHFNRKQWQALNPSSFKSFTHDGRYIALYTKLDGTRGVLIFDPTGQSPFLTTSSQNAVEAITAAYSDARTDTLYLAQGGNIVRYNTGSPLSYVWRSKPFRLASKINFGVAAIEAYAFPVTLKVYADGALKQTKTVTSRDPFKLKPGFKAIEWQFELTGATEVKRLRVATSVDELKQLQ